MNIKAEKVRIETVEQLREWVRKWAHELAPKTVLLLCGEVGAGKTQLVQCLVQEFGGSESSSPSYAIHNHYSLLQRNIDHIDLYRLEDDDDLESTGFWDLFDQEEGIIAIEWADRIDADSLSAQWQTVRIDIQVLDDGVCREFDFQVL